MFTTLKITDEKQCYVSIPPHKLFCEYCEQEKFDDVKIKALYMYDTQTVVLFKKNNPLSDCSPLFKKYLDENNLKIKDIKFL